METLPDTVRYSVAVGRWTGAFFFLRYADVYNVESGECVASYTAFTARGAERKARRAVRRLAGTTRAVVAVGPDSLISV